jgi:hypothetical protein
MLAWGGDMKRVNGRESGGEAIFLLAHYCQYAKQWAVCEGKLFSFLVLLNARLRGPLAIP